MVWIESMALGLNEGGFQTERVPVHMVRVAVAPADSKSEECRCAEAALRLADELGLPLVASRLEGEGFDLLLVVQADRLELCRTGPGAPGGVYADFVGVGSRRRGPRRVGSARQPLAQAVGAPARSVTVVDATAGLGRDSFLLASLGYKVTAVERSPVLGVLLRDGLRRAMAVPNLTDILERRLRVVVGDSRMVLAGMVGEAGPDVVYLDPMFPEKGNASGLAKKEMRVLRLLVGDDEDAAELLAVGRRVARRRVVVKRWVHAPPLGPEPTLAYKGKIARYDVYTANI